MNQSISKLKAPEEIKTLEDLVANARCFATEELMRRGMFEPTLFMLGGDQPIIYACAANATEEEKDWFARTARLMAIASGSTLAAYVFEAWIVTGTQSSPVDPAIRPSQSPNRQEIVGVFGEQISGKSENLILPIERNSNGEFEGFKETLKPTFDSMGGRFAHMLPKKKPSSAEKQLAGQTLRDIGIGTTRTKDIKPINRYKI